MKLKLLDYYKILLKMMKLNNILININYVKLQIMMIYKILNLMMIIIMMIINNDLNLILYNYI
jgi:hypothetical protein